jgi:hypothetical protein
VPAIKIPTEAWKELVAMRNRGLDMRPVDVSFRLAGIRSPLADWWRYQRGICTYAEGLQIGFEVVEDS